jgi:hypothetical protein
VRAFPLLVVVLLTSSCLRWKDTPSSASSGCSGDAACAVGQRCQSGRCVSPSDSTFCTNDGHCASPRTCRGGTCRDYSCTAEEQQRCAPEGCLGGDCAPCERQEDCETGKVCEQGACLLPIDAPCVAHDDCASQICCPSTQSCSEDCPEGAPNSSCRADERDA